MYNRLNVGVVLTILYNVYMCIYNNDNIVFSDVIINMYTDVFLT